MLYCALRGFIRLFAQRRNPALYLTLLLFLSQYSVAQSGTASLSGTITDQNGALLHGVRVTITNEGTGISTEKQTNSAGIYNAQGLTPGRYRVFVTKEGFLQVDARDVTLNVQDSVSRNFALRVGGTSETVQVDGNGININTTDAAVSTVVDRKFVEEIPLNGRSFQSLVLLSPGVTTPNPQGNDPYGQFSVNGQRGDANNFMVDGASANNGVDNRETDTGSAGMKSNTTLLGTTQSILSIDALQEFRIATSTYSAEFGRQPGAQISFQSRAGTNGYHGTAFEYLRNYAFDANNWFNDDSTPPLAKPQERQNDFGGVFGGPLSVPKLFSGRDRAFFFFSYEGLRLSQPNAATIVYVPSNGTFNTATYSNPLYENLRANAPAALQPVLNGLPEPNCSVAQDPQCVDYGDGLSPYIFSSTSPSSIDAISARVDFQLFPWLRTFARYSDTESRELVVDTANYLAPTTNRERVYLLGIDSIFRTSIVNQLRLQYSPASFIEADNPTPRGGAQPANLQALQGLTGGESVFELAFAAEPKEEFRQLSDGSLQFQPNITDTTSWSHGSHLFKGGVDYRQTKAYIGDGRMSRSPNVNYTYDTAAQILANSPHTINAGTFLRQDPTTRNLGLFFQDEWRLRPRLSLSLGLRWDFSPPPSVSGAPQYTYTGNINDPTSLALSRLGAPFYKTTYTDFAPRFGLAATLYDQPGHELVFRGGAGLFYDTGQSFFDMLGAGYGLGASNTHNYNTSNPGSFPLPASIILAPIVTTVVPPYTLTYVPDPHMVPPSTIQWSASLEQALGQSQSITLGYVAALGRKLMIGREYNLTNLNPLFSIIEQYENGPGSNYDALQLQYKRQALHGLQVQASYTWSHTIDSTSSDYPETIPLQRGNSDNDIRNNFISALVYNLPKQYASRLERAILGYWDLDLWFVARSGFPVDPKGSTVTDAVTGNTYAGLLNYNGQNPYVYKKGIPGGRQFNPAVFSVPVASQNGNGTAPRNFLRGFGETEADLSVQRTFPLYEQVGLQFRAEAFNIFNHPNFGAINVTCGTNTLGAVCPNQQLGLATNTLSNALSGSAT